MIYRNKNLRKLMLKHLREKLTFLVEERISFNMLCDLSFTSFDPPLPDEIISQMDVLSLFVMEGYTFDSIELDEHYIAFYAGFGSENFDSLVSIRYGGIVQIMIQDTSLSQELPFFINIANPRFYADFTEENESERAHSRRMLLEQNQSLCKKEKN